MTAHFDLVTALSAVDRAAMLALHQRHFAGSTARSFAEDLAGKTHVLRLHAKQDALVGFSTIDYRPRTFVDGDGAVLYSGDTIVDPEAWSSVNLGSAWLAAVFDLHRERGGGPLWWLLLTSGVRTHRYLRVFSRRHHPAPPARDDPDAAELLPILARERFGRWFDPSSGIVHLPDPQRLLPHLAVVPDHLARDDGALLFLARNPGWRDGDELASLCRLAEDNLTPAALRALEIGRRAVTAVER